MMTFLLALQSNGPTFQKGLPSANRRQDRARQSAKKQGLVTYTDDVGWSITPLGADVARTIASEGFP
jgi:hypothetical protein